MTKKIQSMKQISNDYQHYFFDLDGVIWRGAEKIKGGIQILKYLRQQKKNLYFITNSSVRNRQDLVKRFKEFGFDIYLEEAFPSCYISARYLKQKYPQQKRIITVGTRSMLAEFIDIGLDAVLIDDLPILKESDNIEQVVDTFNKGDYQLRDSIVMGYDKHFTYEKICLISFYIQKGVKFFGTNPDQYTFIKGFKAPGAGSMIKAIQQATGIQPEFAGKPNTFIIESIIEKNKINRKDCIMIGDNLKTDIQFGNRAGVSTLCVLTGVSSEEMVLKANTSKYYAQFLL